jgi:predicted membrane-bound spermidine synthase
MQTLLRRLRGMLGMGLSWAVGWAMVMFIIGSIIRVVDPDSIDAGEEPWRMAGVIAFVGFLSGTAFAAIFASAERRRKIRELSVLRSAVWGALGGAVLPLLTSMNESVLANTMPLGALFAAGTVAIARRAALRETESGEQLTSPAESPRLPA